MDGDKIMAATLNAVAAMESLTIKSLVITPISTTADRMVGD